MPNKKQNMTATKGNMAAQQKGARPDYPDIDGDGNKKESMKQAIQDKNSNAAQQRGRANMAYQSAKVKASKNTKPKPKKKDKVDSAAQKTGKAKSTSSISKASLILNPNKKVFKPINVDYKSNMKLEKVDKSPEMAAQMKGDYAAKMSDTDMGIEYRFGKQATADAKAAQQKGNPIMPDLNKKEYTDSGMNYRDANNASIDGGTVDEENLSNIKTKSPYRPYVETLPTHEIPMRPNSAALPGGGEPGEKLFLDKAAKMHAKHPSMQRMSDMVTKVATYNMPNVKAAQKKYHK
jgi:hypothetical protein